MPSLLWAEACFGAVVELLGDHERRMSSGREGGREGERGVYRTEGRERERYIGERREGGGEKERVRGREGREKERVRGREGRERGEREGGKGGRVRGR